jgi:hypothetical protein
MLIYLKGEIDLIKIDDYCATLPARDVHQTMSLRKYWSKTVP